MEKFELTPTIEPDSALKLIWDIVVLVAIVINIIYIPLDISFSLEIDYIT